MLFFVDVYASSCLPVFVIIGLSRFPNAQYSCSQTLGNRIPRTTFVYLPVQHFLVLATKRIVRAPGADTQHKDEIALLRLRYKQPDSTESKLIERTLKTADIINTLEKTSERFRFSASVAGFGQLLRGGRYTDNYQYDDVLELARDARGRDAFGYRGEFISLVNLAKSLQTTRVKG